MRVSTRDGIRRAAVLVVTAFGLVLFSAASASAAKKFGADLRNNDGDPVQPANAGHTCEEASGGDLGSGKCTRIAYEFSGLGNKAPKDGKLKTLKLVALNPGSFTFYLGKAKVGPEKGKLTRKGPKINYDGDDAGTSNYDIESFSLGGLRVEKGDRIALKANKLSAETCNSGGDRALLFQPPLSVGTPFANADGVDDSCTYLIQVIYK